MKRIVLCGPALAGRTTLLQAIAAANAAVMETVDDMRRQCRGARVQLRRSTVAIETLCGPHKDSETWQALLSGASAVVLVLDGQRELSERNAAWIAQMDQDSTLLVRCVVVAKLDLPNAALATTLQLLAGTRLTGCTVASTCRGDARSAVHAVDALAASL